MRRWALPLLLGALTIAPVAGCGKSEPTKEGYITRANAVCAAEDKDLRELAERRHTPQQLVNESFSIHERANAQLRAIPVPPREKLPGEWLHVRETAIQDGRKILATKPGTRENDAANKAYTRSEAKAVRLALSYSLRSCVGFASV